MDHDEGKVEVHRDPSANGGRLSKQADRCPGEIFPWLERADGIDAAELVPFDSDGARAIESCGSLGTQRFTRIDVKL